MICFRCHKETPSHNRFCSFCNAVLPVNVAAENSSPSLDLEEGRNYQAPRQSYPNSALEGLKQAMEAYYAGEADDEPIVDWTDELQRRFDGLAKAAPEMLQAVREQLNLDKDDEEAHHVAYLIQFGSQIFSDAIARLNQFLDGDGGTAPEILQDLQTGNDYLCESARIVNEMLARDSGPS